MVSRLDTQEKKDADSKCRFLFLLIFLLVMIALNPLDDIIGPFAIILDLSLTVVLIAAIATMSKKRAHTVIGILLAVPLIFSIWSDLFETYEWLMITGYLCGIAFFIFLIATILTFIFSQNEITGDLIAGAVVVYLLLTTMWAILYRVIEVAAPGSFNLSNSAAVGHDLSFMYYSFVTITTLGYGDITPATNIAKTCAALEAVIGQLYLVITVAWLVGVHVSQTVRRRSR